MEKYGKGRVHINTEDGGRNIKTRMSEKVISHQSINYVHENAYTIFKSVQ